VKRAAAWARRGTSPHRLLQVLAAVLLLARLIQPVAPVVAPTIEHHAGAGHETAANTHHPTRHGAHDPDHQGCHFCRFDDIALPPPSVAFAPLFAAFTVAWQTTAQQTTPAPHFLICLQPRAPPRLA
jgi:hypothetical protein